jgi:hypothetical protein
MGLPLTDGIGTKIKLAPLILTPKDEVQTALFKDPVRTAL